MVGSFQLLVIVSSSYFSHSDLYSLPFTRIGVNLCVMTRRKIVGSSNCCFLLGFWCVSVSCFSLGMSLSLVGLEARVQFLHRTLNEPCLSWLGLLSWTHELWYKSFNIFHSLLNSNGTDPNSTKRYSTCTRT